MSATISDDQVGFVVFGASTTFYTFENMDLQREEIKVIKRTYLVILLMLTILTGLSGIASADETAQSDKWEFDAAIYLWGASIGGKTGSGSDIDVSFDDVLSNLEFAFMGEGRGTQGQVVAEADCHLLGR